MSPRSQQVITLASISSLNSSDTEKRAIVWKEFGVYLDKKLDSHINTNKSESSTNSSIIQNSTPDSSYLSNNIKYKICKSCNRPIGEQILHSHYSKCTEMKQRKGQDSVGSAVVNGMKKKKGKTYLEVEPSSVESSRNTTPIPGTPSSTANGTKPRKKYKKSQTQKEKEAANLAAAAALAANTGTVASKKKKQPKPKTTAKPKGPVNVEKQCGVPLPTGGFCARSLTCKTHSMGAKRAVLGRSAPYDVLLQQYQKRNQAKLAANNALAAQRRENAEFTGDLSSVLDSENGRVHKILDPDEETHLVLEGLSKNNPIPLERKIIMPTRYRLKFLYMREAYANALISSGNNANAQAVQASGLGNDLTLANQAISGSIGGLQGRCALVNVDTAQDNTASIQSYSSIPGEMYQVRAPLKAILLTAQYNIQQQQLFQQHVAKLQQQQMLLMKQRQQQQQQQQQQQSATTAQQ